MTRETLDFNKVDQLTLSPVKDVEYVISFDDWQDKKSLVVNLEQLGVSCKVYCGYKALNGRVFDLATTVVHKAPNTSSEIKVRGVLYDGGVSNYVGKVVIEEIARGSSSRLDDKVLVVGNGTRNHSEPIMQIETNDVVALHASSTGRVDEAQLYYLQSRGLSHKEAEDILVKAFLALTKV